MASKEIIWSKRARQEFKATLSYYNHRNGSPTYSQKLVSKLFKTLMRLSREEYLGRPTGTKGIRVLPLDVFLIFYEIREGTIFILSFWDNRRDSKKKITT